jgi:hypothetical protein
MNYDWTSGVFGPEPSNYVFKGPDGKVTGGATVANGSINVDGTVVKKTRKATVAPISYAGGDYKAPPAKAPSSAAGVVKTQAQVKTDPALDEIKKSNALEAEKWETYKGTQKALAAGGFLIDVMNANNAYNAASGQAQLNIMQARNQAADALYRGRQAAMDRQSEGYQAGQDSLLAMAAQGQDVGSAGVQKIQGSYEAIGLFNAMQEEINSMREALGYELEEINYGYQLDQALIARDNAIFGSALNTAVTMGMM